ncbi:MAG: cysteine hydrolase [Phycisphaerae bacterium]|nr:cysteine hydrolase [Phycisphaerae bacterium]
MVLVDMQGCMEDITDWQREALAGCETLLAAARKHNIPVIHVILGCWTKDGSDLEYFKQRMNDLARAEGRDPMPKRSWNSPRRQIYPSLKPTEGEIVLQKTSASAFATTGMETILHNMGMRYLVFAGKQTEGCCGLTAAEGLSRGFLVTMVEDACCSTSRINHLAMLRLFDQQWGRVRDVDTVVREFSAE